MISVLYFVCTPLLQLKYDSAYKIQYRMWFHFQILFVPLHYTGNMIPWEGIFVRKKKSLTTWWGPIAMLLGQWQLPCCIWLKPWRYKVGLGSMNSCFNLGCLGQVLEIGSKGEIKFWTVQAPKCYLFNIYFNPHIVGGTFIFY